MGRALLIENSTEQRAAVLEYLQSRGIDTFTARALSDARALLPALKPDVTTLDVDLADGDAVELIEDIVRAGSRCIVISTRDEAQDRIRALSMGADDYLTRPVHLEELYLRLRNILSTRRTQIGMSNTILDLHGIKVDAVTRAVLNGSGAPGPVLTETELILLRILTENMNRLVSKEVLFDNVYARPYTPGGRFLDVAISRLRIKLKATDIGVELRSVREAGYLLSRRSDPTPGASSS